MSTMEATGSPSRSNIPLILVGVVAAAASCAAAWLAIDRSSLQGQLAAQGGQLQQTQERLTSALATVQSQATAISENEKTLADRDSALAAANRPELPIQLTFRRALLGSGMVATFRNTSPRTLSVAATFTDQSLGRAREFALAVDPNGVAEIGHEEGWPVTSGQTVVVSANGFKPVSRVAP